MLIDAHTHLQSEKLARAIDLRGLVARAAGAGVTAAVSCGCGPDDWGLLMDLTARAADFAFPIFPQFGLHPWRVKGVAPDWQEKLRGVLEANPQAGVGEIGLDNHFSGLADFQTQMHACEFQLGLAAELNRPVTLHCVKAHPETVLMLKRKKFPGPVILHAFSGSKEQVKQYCAVSENIYFSLGSKMTKAEVIAAIPIERILAETDSPDQAGDPGGGRCPPQLRDAEGLRVVNDPSQLPAVIERIAVAHGLSFEVAAVATRENTIRAFSLSV